MSIENPPSGTVQKENENKPRCLICGTDAVCTFTPDLDITGLNACEAHGTDVQIAYDILIYLGESDLNEYLASFSSDP